jgi:hypothetical protein
MAGARLPQRQANGAGAGALENIRRLSPAAGRRGRQERNCASVRFRSFINNSG